MKRNILIVDDEDFIRQLVSLILETAGYAVIEAANGKDAINKLNASNVEMVITDLRMPQMDGITLIKELRRKPQYRFLPILMLTSEFQACADGDEGRVDVNDWILKPFAAKQLLHSIKRHIG